MATVKVIKSRSKLNSYKISFDDITSDQIVSIVNSFKESGDIAGK
jgi:hypothetical protein